MNIFRQVSEEDVQTTFKPLFCSSKPVWNMSNCASFSNVVIHACIRFVYKRYNFSQTIFRMAAHNYGEERSEHAGN